MAVTLAGIPAAVISVSATEVVVLPGRPFVGNCQDLGGASRIVNVNTGDVATGPDFVYLVVQTRPVIASMTPGRAQGSIGSPPVIVTFVGPNVENADQARFGPRNASISVGTPSDGIVTAVLPQSEVIVSPACPSGVSVGTQIQVESVGVTLVDLNTGCGSTPPVTFIYTLPCVVPRPRRCRRRRPHRRPDAPWLLYPPPRDRGGGFLISCG